MRWYELCWRSFFRWVPNPKANSLLSIKKSPWNRFRYISKDPKDWYLNVVVTVSTRALTIPEISDSRLFRLRQIYELHRSALNDAEIADLLNTLSIKPPRTKAKPRSKKAFRCRRLVFWLKSQPISF